MAYVTGFDEQDQDQQQSGGPLVPGSAQGNTPTASTGGAAGDSKPKTPGRFANLNEYLRVNAPQEFGQKLAGKVGDDVTTAQNTLGTASNEFKQRADQSTIQDSSGLISKVNEAPETIDVDAFSGLRDAQYQGPTNFSSAGDLYNQTVGQASGAAGKAAASKTEGGRFALLDSYFGKPNYSQGQKTLDNLIVQNDPNSQQAFKQIQANAQNLQSNIGQTGRELSDYGAQAKGKTEATRKAARDALGIDDTGNVTGSGAIGGVKSAVDSRLAEYKAKADAYAQAANDKNYAQIDPALDQTLKDIGISYGVDPRQFLQTTDSGSLNEAGVASAEELSRMRALAKLASLNDPYAAEGAGKYYGDDFYNFDKDQYAGRVGAQKQSFENASKQVRDQLPAVEETVSTYSRTLATLRAQGDEGSDRYQKQLAIYNDAVRKRDDLKNQLAGIYSRYDVPYADTQVGGGVTGIAGGGIK
jgi:hypothetical protein